MVPAAPDPTLAAMLALIPNLGVAVVFIAAWFQERKERQELNAKMLEMQTAHRAEMMRVLEKQFEVMATMHLTSMLNPIKAVELPQN